MKAFDIETVPNPDMLSRLPEPEVKFGNIKDPAKIEEKIKEAKQQQVDKMALNPFYGRICSFSCFGPKDHFFEVIPEISEAAEIELVRKILEHLVVANPETNKIITWNGMNFDFPYVYKRAIILKVPLPLYCAPLNYWTKKYTREPHTDIMQELCGWNTENRINLDDAGKLFLGEGKTKRDYSTYPELIKSGQGNLVGFDNLNDTEHTYKIYEIVSPYLF
jgi:DNA polymerase elongation subunit (family B)